MKVTKFSPGWTPTEGFRSDIEARTAAELHRLHIIYRYEEPVVIDGREISYLPDFLILGSADGLENVDALIGDDGAEADLTTLNVTRPLEAFDVPRWIECKPQEMLYDTRDALGVTRGHGERFKEDVLVTGVELRHVHEELRKPMRLAQLTGESVLVNGGVGGNEMLSITFRPDGVLFSRSNRFVNSVGAERRAQREAQRAKWEAEREAQRAKWEEERQRTQERSAADALDRARALAAHTIVMFPKFASACYGCGAHGTDGYLYHPTVANGSSRWLRLCDDCFRSATT